ncbi:transposase [Thermodesulfobacterium hydrogeniphilum]|uniref:transposase n=1 Tax=Thermodesulfobacterium hydrogeniphilum TaxID=161156 RepID=UPI00146FC834
MVKSWETNWNTLTAFFRYPLEIRRVMYTTNIIESVNSKFRKAAEDIWQLWSWNVNGPRLRIGHISTAR